MNRPITRIVAAWAACAVLTTGVVGAAVPASATQAPPTSKELSLPAPTGKYRVSMVALHVVDRSRADPWQPAIPYRELMISVYYPARRVAGFPPAEYMLPRAATQFGVVDTNGYLGLRVPTDVNWADTISHVVRGAPVAAGGRRRPVLIYSPGLGEPRTWGTTLVADLASRGYVVVTIDNTYESPEVQVPPDSLHPGGALLTLTLPENPDAFIRVALDVRVADTRFVLDQLAALDAGMNPAVDTPPLPAGLAGSLDLASIGLFGHSMGGSAAALTMDADPRIGAGLNMDGNLTYYDGSLMPPAQHGLDRPFLLLGKDGTTDTGPGWSAFLANTPGWARELTLLGSEHASTTDAEALLPQLGLDPSVLSGDIGTISPAEAIRTDEAYVAAFFGRFLRSRDNHLLDGPSPGYPNMSFVD